MFTVNILRSVLPNGETNFVVMLGLCDYAPYDTSWMDLEALNVCDNYSLGLDLLYAGAVIPPQPDQRAKLAKVSSFLWAFCADQNTDYQMNSATVSMETRLIGMDAEFMQFAQANNIVFHSVS